MGDNPKKIILIFIVLSVIAHFLGAGIIVAVPLLLFSLARIILDVLSQQSKHPEKNNNYLIVTLSNAVFAALLFFFSLRSLNLPSGYFLCFAHFLSNTIIAGLAMKLGNKILTNEFHSSARIIFWIYAGCYGIFLFFATVLAVFKS